MSSKPIYLGKKLLDFLSRCISSVSFMKKLMDFLEGVYIFVLELDLMNAFRGKMWSKSGDVGCVGK